MLNPNSYHLPIGSYWACTSNYNGLSQLSRFSTTQTIADSTRKQLRNTKISSTIVKQLN